MLADVDHANLNLDVDWLAGIIPTTENLAVAIWRRLEGGLPGVTPGGRPPVGDGAQLGGISRRVNAVEATP